MEDAMAAFETVCRAFADPTFYPHPVTSVHRIDTHISAVFLTGLWVYKLKKPVNFGFLDFSRLELRCHYCHREVLLNQRFSRGVYAKVVTIRRGPFGTLSLDGPGSLVECAVVMRQLPLHLSLEALLAQGTLKAEHWQKLGERLADLYAQAERNDEIRHFGTLSVISQNVLENFDQTAPFVGDLLDAEKWHLIYNVNDAFVESHSDLFDTRLKEDRICDGHGDLRSDHIYFADDGIQIIDAIEFNDRFRFGDVAADLAFLHMDLDHRGAFSQSLMVLHAYARRAHDPSLYRVLDFYACYRAMVRVKVSCLRFRELVEDEGRDFQDAEATASRHDAARFLDLAYIYAATMTRPTLYVFCGLPASGKSFHARRLAEAFQLSYVASDVLRRELFREFQEDLPEKTAYGAGLYHKDRRRVVYAHLLNRAHEQLKHRRSVILDATFSERKWREEALRLARDQDANVILVECRCSENTLARRLATRDHMPGLSDARIHHLPHFIQEFEPLTEPVPSHSHLVCDTEGNPNDVFYQLLSDLYAFQCAQSRIRLAQ
ncbi:bifunctional aminoglycoside phosphotransferase/ATP-binding protein [Desulfosoma caldarium]|uniref:Aminoglycoside phosphotransferase domain-containing protein n=1 Tax=Desulfosoma caldarium TaxID=610254 RepID=A0A3N1UQ52_9BACT|nr:AAA family ATPase [Desulfosoma caldarium]ROQ90647.1 hypothetical protein EDC27_2528 [Desulfosoma caldarium]